MSTRRVIIREPNKPEQSGWFHVWAGLNAPAYALVEVQDGRMICVPPEWIQFVLIPVSTTRGSRTRNSLNFKLP